MSRTTKNNGRPEESICERFAYSSHLGVYPNSSDIKELSEIASLTLKVIQNG